MIRKGYRKQAISRAAKTLLLLFICFVSCQTEKEDFSINDVSNGGRFMILPVLHQHKMEISTRALSGSYSEFTPEDGEVIYAWAHRYAKGNVTDSLINGEFRRSGSKWYSSVEVKSGESYSLFTFHPGGISSKRGEFTIANGDSSLSVNPITILTLGEPSIAIAAARAYYNNGKYTSPDLTAGKFDLGEISANSLNKDKASLAMNLLYAKANMSFTLDTVYSKLRSIVITDVKMVTTRGKSSMSLNFSATSAPTWGAYADSTIELSLPIPGDSIILSRTTTTTWDEGVFEGYQYQDAGSFCYLPKSDLPVKLSVTYNVYFGDIIPDSLTSESYKNRMSLVRKGQTATNGTIMPTGTGIPRAGTSYNVKISVVPSYLYQLSDDDLDNKLPIE